MLYSDWSKGVLNRLTGYCEEIIDLTVKLDPVGGRAITYQKICKLGNLLLLHLRDKSNDVGLNVKQSQVIQTIISQKTDFTDWIEALETTALLNKPSGFRQLLQKLLQDDNDTSGWDQEVQFNFASQHLASEIYKSLLDHNTKILALAAFRVERVQDNLELSANDDEVDKHISRLIHIFPLLPDDINIKSTITQVSDLLKSGLKSNAKLSDALDKLHSELENHLSQASINLTIGPSGVKTTKDPSNKAREAYLLTYSFGLKQEEIAEKLSKKYRKKISQGQVSRLINQYKSWAKAHNLPTETASKNKTSYADPAKLDLGTRTDGKKTGTPRHSSDSD